MICNQRRFTLLSPPPNTSNPRSTPPRPPPPPPTSSTPPPPPPHPSTPRTLHCRLAQAGLNPPYAPHRATAIPLAPAGQVRGVPACTGPNAQRRRHTIRVG